MRMIPNRLRAALAGQRLERFTIVVNGLSVEVEEVPSTGILRTCRSILSHDLYFLVNEEWVPSVVPEPAEEQMQPEESRRAVLEFDIATDSAVVEVPRERPQRNPAAFSVEISFEIAEAGMLSVQPVPAFVELCRLYGFANHASLQLIAAAGDLEVQSEQNIRSMSFQVTARAERFGNMLTYASGRRGSIPTSFPELVRSPSQDIYELYRYWTYRQGEVVHRLSDYMPVREMTWRGIPFYGDLPPCLRAGLDSLSDEIHEWHINESVRNGDILNYLIARVWEIGSGRVVIAMYRPLIRTTPGLGDRPRRQVSGRISLNAADTASDGLREFPQWLRRYLDQAADRQNVPTVSSEPTVIETESRRRLTFTHKERDTHHEPHKLDQGSQDRFHRRAHRRSRGDE